MSEKDQFTLFELVVPLIFFKDTFQNTSQNETALPLSYPFPFCSFLPVLFMDTMLD